MANDFEKLPFVQIYGQTMWHAPAAIVGTEAGLRALRDAITRCLASGKDDRADVFVTDGEGYDCQVELRSFREIDSMPPPYVEEMAGGQYTYSGPVITLPT